MARRRGSRTSVRVSVPDAFYEPIRVRTALQLLEDRRLFHPARDLRPVRSFFTKPRLVIPPAKRPMRNGAHYLPSKIGFEVPKHVAICVRRKTRKEVIIAKRVARNGGGAKHRNIWSEIKC